MTAIPGNNGQSGCINMPRVYCGDVYEIVEPVTLYDVGVCEPHVIAETGDLFMVLNVGIGYRMLHADLGTEENHYTANIMFFDGNGMGMSEQEVLTHKRLKDFPRKLDEMRRYKYKP